LTFNRVVLSWEAAYGTAYQIQVSSNDSTWSTVYTRSGGSGGLETLNFSSTTARYVRMYGTARATQWGYSLWAFEVYNTTSVQYAITASAGSGGSISPSGTVSVNAGASQPRHHAQLRLQREPGAGGRRQSGRHHLLHLQQRPPPITRSARASSSRRSQATWREQTTTASSVEASTLPAANATDGNASTRWSRSTWILPGSGWTWARP